VAEGLTVGLAEGLAPGELDGEALGDGDGLGEAEALGLGLLAAAFCWDSQAWKSGWLTAFTRICIVACPSPHSSAHSPLHSPT
jgi:hypothetical protein